MGLRITSSHIRRVLTLLVWVIAGAWFITGIPDWRQGGQFPYEAVVAFLTGLVALLELRDIEDAGRLIPIHSLSSSRHLRYRKNFIARVKLLKIQGVLQKALHETIPLVLGLADYPQALARPMMIWDRELGVREIGSTEEVLDIFDDSGQSLLILGAPGSGKTFTLLNLCAALLERAGEDASNPIPVLLDLATWADKQRPLDQWLMDEVMRKYDQASPITEAWLAQDNLCLLLDGLDEVREDVRDGCVQAINKFKAVHNVSMAVSSRIGDYNLLAERLNLTRAVMIQPLTEAQVAAYLTDPKLQLSAVYFALKQDDALRELSTTPLILNIMTVAYRGVSLEELQPLMLSVELRRAHLYNAYIRSVFTWRPLREERYSPRQALKWLRYLATQMSQRTETQFFIRDLQLDWLPLRVKAQIRLFWVGLYGILGGVMGGVLIGVASVVQGINLVESLSAGWFMILGGFLAGILLGSTDHFHIPIEVRRGMRRLNLNWRWFRQVMIKKSFEVGIIFFGGLAAISAVIAGYDLVEFLFHVLRSIFFGVLTSIFISIMFLFFDSFPLYSLRGALALYGFLPFDIEGFLETMESRVLVQGIGTYYQFIHRTFQEHIAALTDEEIEQLAALVDG